MSAIAALGQTEQSFLVAVDFAMKYIVTIALRKKCAQFVQSGHESGGPTGRNSDCKDNVNSADIIGGPRVCGHKQR